MPVWKDRCPRAKEIRGAREETADEDAEGWGGCLVPYSNGKITGAQDREDMFTLLKGGLQ